MLKLDGNGEAMVRLALWRHGIGLCLALASVLAGVPAAARTLGAIRADGVLKVGFAGDYAPYALRGPDGAITGADVTMAQALAGDLRVKLQIVATSWTSMTNEFKAGRFDIARGGVSVTAAREDDWAFSIPGIQAGNRPIVRCGDNDRYT